jgi:hypothetical protein
MTEPLAQRGPQELHEEVTPESTTKVQKPVYFISIVLRGARERYTTQQKLLYTAYNVKETTSLLPRPPNQGGH